MEQQNPETSPEESRPEIVEYHVVLLGRNPTGRRFFDLDSAERFSAKMRRRGFKRQLLVGVGPPAKNGEGT